MTSIAFAPPRSVSAPSPLETAEAHWKATAPALGGRVPRMVVSPDGGRGYPFRPVPLSAAPPSAPAAVLICDPGTGYGHFSALDFDLSRARAAGHSDPASAVNADADAAQALIVKAGGRCLRDIAPTGGQHLYILWSQSRPWEQLRDLASALALRFRTVDPSPHQRVTGVIRPPGARYKLVRGRSPGWQRLLTPLQDVPGILAAPCGPIVWKALHLQLAPELSAVTGSPGPRPPVSDSASALDSKGSPWISRRRTQLPPPLDRIARTGTKGRYASGSEARYAVLCSAAARGWHLDQVTSAMEDGTWAGLSRLYSRYRTAATREREITADWRKAVRAASRQKNAPSSHTRQNTAHSRGQGDRDLDELTVHEQIWTWRTAAWLAERDRKDAWGEAGAGIRLTLRALAAAMQITGNIETEFGIRDLSLHCGLSYRTVAAALEILRTEDDPLIERVRTGRGIKADRYKMRIPAAYAGEVRWLPWRAGIIRKVHPVFRILGPSAALVHECLTNSPATLTSVAGEALLGTAAARRALLRLAEQGLAVRSAGGWARGPVTLDEAGDACGAPEAEEETKRRYAEQRRAWRKRLETRGDAPPEPGEEEDEARAPSRPPLPVAVPVQRSEPDPPRGPPADRTPDDVLGLLRRELGAEVVSVQFHGGSGNLPRLA